MSDKAAVTKSTDAFRTISEVSESLEIPQHVLRFWETKFTQVKPMKRAGGVVITVPVMFHYLEQYVHCYTMKAIQLGEFKSY